MPLSVADLEATLNINLDPLKAALLNAKQQLTAFTSAAGTQGAADLTAFEKSANAASGTLGVFKERLADAKISMQQLGGAVAGVGRLMSGGITAPLAALGAGSLAAAADVNKALIQIEAQTGATGARAAMLSDSFKQVGASVPNSLGQVGQAIATLSQRTGLLGAPLNQLSTQFLTLARLTGSDVNPLITQSTRVFQQWGVSVKDQSGALDQFLRAHQATGIAVQQLLQQIDRFTPSLKNAGLSLADSEALLGAFGRDTGTTDKIMQGLNTTFTKWAKAGITDAHGALSNLITAIEKAPTPMKALQVATEAGMGGRGGAAFVNIVRAGGLEFQKFVAQIAGGRQTIQSTGQETETFSQTFQRLRNNVELALAPLGQAFGQVLAKLADFMVPVLQRVQELGTAFLALPLPVKALAVALAALAASMGPVLMAGGFLIAQVPGIIAGWEAVATYATATFGPAVTALGATFTALLPVLALAAGATALLATAWTRDLGGVRTTATEFWAGMTVLWNQGMAVIGSLLAKDWAADVENFQAGMRFIADGAASGWASITAGFTAGIERIRALLTGGWGAITAPFRAAFSNLPPFVGTIFEGVGHVIQTAFATIGKYIHDAAPGLFDAVAKVGGFFAHWFNKAGFDAGVQELKAGWNTIIDAGKGAIAQANAEAAAAQKAANAAAAAEQRRSLAEAMKGAFQPGTGAPPDMTKPKKVKLSPEDREEERLQAAVNAAQEQYNALLDQSSTIAGKVAREFGNLHTADAAGLRARLVLLDQNIAKETKRLDGAARFRQELESTEQKIREIQDGVKPGAAVGANFGPGVSPAQIKMLEDQRQRLKALDEAATKSAAFQKQLSEALKGQQERHAELTGTTKSTASAEELFTQAVASNNVLTVAAARKVLDLSRANDALAAANHKLTAAFDGQYTAVQATVKALDTVTGHHEALFGITHEVQKATDAYDDSLKTGIPLLQNFGLASIVVAQNDADREAHLKAIKPLQAQMNALLTQAQETIAQYGAKITLTAKAQEDLSKALADGDAALIAQARSTLAAAQAADALTVAHKDGVKAQSEYNKGINQVANALEGQFTKAFENVSKGGFQHFFSNMLTGLDQLLTQMAAKILAADLTNLFFGDPNSQGQRTGGLLGSATGAIGGAASSSGGQGGLGGLLGGLVTGIGGLIGSLFGGGGSSLGGGGVAGLGAGLTPALNAGALGQAFSGPGATDSVFGAIPGLASGGNLFPGQAAWVGEKGPELLMPTQGAHVMSNAQSRQMVSGHTFNINVTTPNPQAFQKAQGNLMSDLSRSAKLWDTRNNSQDST